MDDDFALLEAWRQGDRDAGDALIQRNFDIVCRFFRNRLDHDVEDLVQRTFLECVENRGRIREQVSFRAFVLTVARYRFYDHLRSKQPTRGGTPLSQLSLRDLGTSPSLRVTRKQEETLLLEEMAQINADQQIALELAYWEQLSGPEIAAVLGIEANTVRSRLARARAALRERMEQRVGQGAACTALGAMAETSDGRRR